MHSEEDHIHSNVPTSFITRPTGPILKPTSFVHPLGVVIGAVTVGRNVFVAPLACVRGDEGSPIHIGDDSNVQDGVVIHGLETFDHGHVVTDNLCEVTGRQYSVYVGKRVSLAHQCQVHGPAVVGDNTFVGMQALVFKSQIGPGCVIEPAAKVLGVRIAAERYVPAGEVVRTQAAADALPEITKDYDFYGLNDKVVEVNVELARGYRAAGAAPTQGPISI